MMMAASLWGQNTITGCDHVTVLLPVALVFRCCLSCCLIDVQRQGVGGRLCGRRVNNLLCLGHIQLISLGACCLWADGRQDLIMHGDADGAEHATEERKFPISVAVLVSVSEPRFVSALLMMLPFSAGTATFQPPLMP